MSETPLTLDKIGDDSDLFASFIGAAKPVLIVGAAKRMRAFTRWTNEYLLETLAGMRPTVRFEDGRLACIPIEAFFDYFRDPIKFTSSHGKLYLTDLYVKPVFSDPRREILGRDSEFPLPRKDPYVEWISLYVGPAGTWTPCHQDIFSTHTWMAQLRGQKLWRVWPPDSRSSDAESTCMTDPYEVLMEPGDIIYLPPNWWHEVQNVSASLAISGNFCSVSQARTALSESERSDSTNRDVWIRTWTQILFEQTHA